MPAPEKLLLIATGGNERAAKIFRARQSTASGGSGCHRKPSALCISLKLASRPRAMHFSQNSGSMRSRASLGRRDGERHSALPASPCCASHGPNDAYAPLDLSPQRCAPGRLGRAASPQAAILKALFMPDLIGSLVSVATFWASEENSLLCATKASNCLRVWALVSSTASDSDFTPSRSVAKSNPALVFAALPDHHRVNDLDSF